MDKNSVLEQYANNEELDFIFFWGHTSKGDSVGKECLSQWYPAIFEIDGIKYITAEHYMMAEKARLFNDTDALNKVLKTNDPHKAKEHGRKVKDYDENDWEKQRFDIVVRGNQAKFSQNEKLKNFLISTGKSILVEASPYDRIWGIGMKQDNPDANNPAKWRGLNLLGFALMEVRNEISNYL